MFRCYSRLYIAGAEPQLQNLYGKVEYPVVKGTPMISPMIKWDHSNDYVVADFMEKVRCGMCKKIANVYFKAFVPANLSFSFKSFGHGSRDIPIKRLSVDDNKRLSHSQSSGSGDNHIEVDIKTDNDKYLTGHTIDGRVLYPAAGYIVCTGFSRFFF